MSPPKQEVFVYPSGVFDLPPLPGKAWWLIYTRASHEKALMRSLMAHDIPFFTPIVRHVYRSPQGRRRTSFLPIFPGYVFLWGEETDCFLANNTRHVVSFQQMPDQREFSQGAKLLLKLLEICQADVDMQVIGREELNDRIPLGLHEAVIEIKRKVVDSLIIDIHFPPLLPNVLLEINRIA